MLENIRMSFQGIWSHKMRSFLTMLGIIIGIAAIIAIVSTIKGTSEQIKDNLVGSRNNIVDVQLNEGNWQYVSGQSYTDVSSVPTISDEVIEQIKDIDEVSDAVAYRYGGLNYGIAYGSEILDSAYAVGTTNKYFDLMDYNLVSGRLFEDVDYKNYNKCIIIDDTVVKSLFGDVDPIGKSVEINNNVYVVIGVVEQINTFSPEISSLTEWYTYYASDASGKVFFTDAIWPLLYSFDEPYHVKVKANSTEDMTRAGKKTEDLLNDMFVTDTMSMENIDEAEESSLKYKSQDLLETAQALQEVSNSTNQQLIWIASISLLVGGIGVMNIMLVSVTERTREIGLKKALGARKGIILGQFLTEAAVLTTIGGILGVGGGIGLAYLISNIAEVPVAISVPAIVISVLFSVVIGILFGLLPSVKAANLNPIDALRYE